MHADNKPIAITIGDAAGIGPEIIVKAFCQAPEQFHNCIVVGDKAVMQRAWQVLAAKPRPMSRPMPMNMPKPVPVTVQEGLSIQQVGIPLAAEQLPVFGQISAVAGQLAADSITWADPSGYARRSVSDRHSTPSQRGAVVVGREVSWTHRNAASFGGTTPEQNDRSVAGAHDAGQSRAQNCVGHYPPTPAPSD